MIRGSDRVFDENPSHPVFRMLRSKGIAIVPQDGGGIDASFDFAVFSTAVENDSPDLRKARALGIPLKSRPEYLAEIVDEFKTIAVAGTSGKSTTSGLLAFMLRRLGLSPNFIGGGRVKQFRTEESPGNSTSGSSDYLVIEACESDGTIVNFKPLHTVILNLDLDHHSIAKTREMFQALATNTAGMVIVNADDHNLEGLSTRHSVTFSIDNPSDYRATDILYRPFSTEFSVKTPSHSTLADRGRGRHGGTVEGFGLSLPGEYNLYNALSCIAILCEMGMPLEETRRVLHEFRGIERRFDVHLNDGKRLVIDDYAHNPHKISALMKTVRNMRDRVCYIFQPHGFGPTRMMKREYIEAFRENLRASDHLILLPIFYAGGTANRDISSKDLAEGIREGGKSVEVVEERDRVLDPVRAWDTCVVLGARDETLSHLAEAIAGKLTFPRDVVNSCETVVYSTEGGAV